MREAQRAGLAVPTTEQPGEAELASFGDGRLVVKPRHTFLEGADVRLRTRLVCGPAEARAATQELRAAGAEPIIQERLDGKLMAFTALTDRDARIVAQVQQVADLIWPPEVGVSARAHTVAIDEQLAAGVARLLSALGWFGLANLQFILGEDGVPRLLDFNGRFYGSLALAVAAGPNLPAIWARLATGRPLGAVREAQPGTRYQWFACDLRACVCEKTGWRRAGAALASAIRAPQAKHATWSLWDPWPAIANYSRKLLRWMLRRS